MDSRAPNPATLIDVQADREDEPNEGGSGHDFGFYRRNGRGHYTKMTITLSAVCLIVGGLVRGVWDVSEYSHDQADARQRIVSLEANGRLQQTLNETMQRQINVATDRSDDMRTRMTALETTLNQANGLLQKLSESNARLEERVIFLVAQVEGRMSAPSQNKQGRKP